MAFEVNGWNVIVTGGTRGIGRAVSELFLRNGAAVTAIYAGNAVAAEEMKQKFSDYPFVAIKLDVADYGAVDNFFREYEQSGKSLEVLVNSAGIRRDNIVGMMSPGEWHSVIETNLTGTFNMCKFAVMKMMPARFGRIINITSPSGKTGFAGQANYAASKAGQAALSKSLSRETAKRGITVNCVSPGFIDTELIADLPDELRAEYKAMIPMKKFGTPEDVAAAVRFLSSRDANYITGSILEVTGGL